MVGEAGFEEGGTGKSKVSGAARESVVFVVVDEIRLRVEMCGILLEPRRLHASKCHVTSVPSPM